jgi:hypothetical protein
MGIFSDTFEDNRERAYELFPVIPVEEIPREARPAPRPRPLFPCPACFKTFGHRAVLDDHLFAVHSKNSFFVRVNGSVAGEVSFVRELESLEVVPLGSEPASIEVEVLQPSPSNLTAAPGSALGLLSQPMSDGQVRVRVKVGAVARIYDVFVRSVPPLDFGPLDSLVEDAQRPLLLGQQANWEVLTNAAHSAETLPSRYLRGHAEYLMGVNFEGFEADWRSASRRWEAAYGLLRPFASRRARLCSSIIEFRMDAFDRLLALGPSSRFWLAANFFRSPPRMVVPQEFVPHEPGGVWIDQGQEDLIEAVRHFFEADLAKSSEALRRVPIGSDPEPGVWRKATVLRARLAEKVGDAAQAKAAFEALLGDPVFDAEARSAMNGAC